MKRLKSRTKRLEVFSFHTNIERKKKQAFTISDTTTNSSFSTPFRPYKLYIYETKEARCVPSDHAPRQTRTFQLSFRNKIVTAEENAMTDKIKDQLATRV